MANDSVQTISYEEFNNGIADMKGLVDIDINTSVYVVSDDTVSAVYAGISSATIAKRFGWTVRPFDFSDDKRVGVQSKYNRRTHRTVATGATVAAGDHVALDQTIPTTIRPWVRGTDEEDLKIGQCLVGAIPAATAHIAEE